MKVFKKKIALTKTTLFLYKKQADLPDYYLSIDPTTVLATTTNSSYPPPTR